jgi:hypothetical protein
MGWLVLLFIVLALVTGGNLVLALVITAAVVAGAYGLSLGRRPFRACRTCGGRGRHPGRIFTYAHRACPRCGGSGRHRRWGVVQFWDDRRTPAEEAAARAAYRRNRPR